MGRYQPPNIFFFAPTDLTTALNSGSTRPLEDLRITSRLGGIGEFEATYPYPHPIDGSYIAFGAMEAIGNVVIFTYVDDRYPSGAGRIRAFGDCYRIESAIVEDRPQAGPVVRLKGRSLMAELEDTPVWNPIGSTTTYNTTILTGKAIPAPSTSSTTAAYTAGDTEITLASGAAFRVDDMVLIPLIGGGTAITTIQSKDDATPNVITLATALPGSVASGATITRRARALYPTSTEEMVEGSKVVITLNSGTFTTLIERGPEKDTDDVEFVLVRDGVTGAANAGNAIATSNTSAPTTSDISQVIANAPGWSSDTSGIGSGSAHVPEGTTVYDLLLSIAEIHGTVFKQGYDSTGTKPLRQIKWGIGNSGTTGKIDLANPPASLLPSFEASTNRGVINGAISREWRRNVVTRIYPTGGDPGVSLYGVSSSVISILTAAGLTIVTDPAVLGLYTEPYIKNNLLEPATVVGKSVTFGDIVPETSSPTASLNACDMLALRAMEWLLGHDRSYWEWRITDVEIASAVVLEVGQYVDLLRYFDAQTIRPTYATEALDNLITREVTLTWNREKAYPAFDLVLSDQADNPQDAGRAVATAFRTYDRMTRRSATGRDNLPSIGYIGAPTPPSGGGGVTDHGLLTGLADNDHTQYLMSATDGSLVVSGQGIRIADFAAGAGLSLTTGTLAVQVSTALGTLISSDVVGVAAQSDGGLQVGASGVKVLKPANSGLVADATGLYLAPSTLTAATTNAVSGTGHTHAVTATEDANTTVSTLLKGSATGALTVAALGVGIPTSTAATIYARSKAVDDYTLYLKQLSGQTASILRAEDTSGNALIVLTGAGDLESGNPGFVSGLTGWQITADGDAEFNNAFIRGELHAITFVADEMHATGGTLAVMTATNVWESATLPAQGSTVAIKMRASYATGLSYFAVNDVLRMKPMGDVVSGGELYLPDLYFVVTAVGARAGQDTANGEPGYYSTTCRRVQPSGATATGFVVAKGTSVVKWGEIGGSGYTGGMILTSDLNLSPYIDIFTVDASQSSATWQSAAVIPKPRVRLGNLDGVLGLTEQWGLAAGTDLSDTSLAAQYIVASDLGLNLRNIDLKMYNGANPTVLMSSVGALRMGTDTGSIATITFDFSPTDGSLRIGPFVNGKPFLNWDGTELGLYQRAGGVTTPIIVLNSSGASYFAGPMTISTAGGIWQGTGSFASPTTGLKIYNSGGVALLSTYNGGTAQVQLDSAGKLVAGAGSVWLNSSGVSIKGITSGSTDNPYVNVNAISFYGSDGTTLQGYVAGTDIGSVAGRGVRMQGAASAGPLYNYLEIGDGGAVLACANTVYIYSNTGGAGQGDLQIYARTMARKGLYSFQEVIAGGGTLALTANTGQIVSEIETNNHNAIILRANGAVAHGITDVVVTQTYGTISFVAHTTGGLLLRGLTEGQVGVQVNANVTTVGTGETTGANAAINLSTFLKSGTGVTSFAADDNILAVRNNTDTQFIVKGNGDFYYNGAGAAYDALDDVALLRTLSREQWGGAIETEWDSFLTTNRQSLIDAGILSAGGFINGSALNRLLVGAIGQLHSRIRNLEGTL